MLAGVNPKLSFHMSRRSFANVALTEGWSVRLEPIRSRMMDSLAALGTFGNQIPAHPAEPPPCLLKFRKKWLVEASTSFLAPFGTTATR